MIVSVHQPQYLAWLGYFHKIYKSDCFVFLTDVQYKDREFQNRNKIRAQDSWIWLTVPVISKGKGRQKISQVAIDNSLPWQRKHWQSLKTGYGSAAFFDAYAGFFETFYAKHFDRLADLNIELIRYLMDELEIKTQIRFDTELGIEGARTDRIIEICEKLGADTYLSGAGGRDYLEEGKFAAHNIKLVYQDFAHPVYQQSFAGRTHEFIPYLAAVDLLFNQGAQAKEILRGGSL